MTGDVFQKDPLRGAFPNDAGDLRPEVAGVIGTTALASGAEGLAGISGEDDVEGTAERAGIETAQIIPDWRGCEVACALGGDEDATGIALPFDKDACVVSGFSEHEPRSKPPPPAQRESPCRGRDTTPFTAPPAVEGVRG